MDGIYLLVWWEQAQRAQHHMFLLRDSALHFFKAVKQETLFVLHAGSMVRQNSVEQYIFLWEKADHINV